MKFALVDELKVTPTPKTQGFCPFCGGKVIAKCGDIKRWHWSHSKRECDVWWENETQWHRDWKNCFPEEWQEIIQIDKNSVKHIADVKTNEGWVLEFQHSYLKPDERKARNIFYGKLVWIVDGLRRSRDKTQFFESLNELRPVWENPLIRKVYLDNGALLRDWSRNPAPVLFDFGDDMLWCLLPVKQDWWGYVAAFPRHKFIELHNKTPEQVRNFEEILNHLNAIAIFLEQKKLQERERYAQVSMTWARPKIRKVRL